MTNTTETPKKNSIAKQFFAEVVIIFTILGINHYTYRIGYPDVVVTLTDSNIVVGSDTASRNIVADTTRKDTLKK